MRRLTLDIAADRADDADVIGAGVLLQITVRQRHVDKRPAIAVLRALRVAFDDDVLRKPHRAAVRMLELQVGAALMKR